MHRRIMYVEPAAFDSLGRNGRMTTTGCYLGLYEARQPTILMAPITSRGVMGRAEVTVDAEAAGEVGAFFVEAFCLHATPEAREALRARLEAICAGEPDPARVAEAAEAAEAAERDQPQPPGMR